MESFALNIIIIALFSILLTFIVVKVWRWIFPANAYSLTDDEPLISSEDFID